MKANEQLACPVHCYLSHIQSWFLPPLQVNVLTGQALFKNCFTMVLFMRSLWPPESTPQLLS